jgi:tripartite-type tricarboxylate transporter receptor subunit TctC
MFEVRQETTVAAAHQLRLSPAIIAAFNRRMQEQLATPEIRQAYLAQGEEPAYTTVAEFAQLMREDYVQMGKMVRLAGIQPE